MVDEKVRECFTRITGITEDELPKIQGMVLTDEILDSLSIVALLSLIEKSLACTLPTNDFNERDFESLERIISAVTRVINP